MQNAGYNTLYTGKLFNAHTVDNYNRPFPNGFNSSDFLLDPYTYSYLNATYQRDFEPPVSYEGQYTTDILKEKALGFLNSAIDHEYPFFLTIAPVAPHSNVLSNDGPIVPSADLSFSAPISAERHKHLFENVKIPRTLNFNPDEVIYAQNRSRLIEANLEVQAKRRKLDQTHAQTESKQREL